MKPFAKRLLALASAAAITLSLIPTVRSAEEPAAPLPQARLADFIPEAEDPGAAPLTRLGMSELLVDAYCTLTDITDEELGEPEMVYVDTMNTDVLNARSLELVADSGSGFYEPMESVSRQDFFTACADLLESVGYPYVQDIELDLNACTDGGEVAEYAAQSVRALLCLEILSPNEEGALEPAREITLDEATELTARLTEFYTGWEADPVEPQRYLGEEIAEYALNYVGCRYVRGGQGPRKFDCSGFVYYVYKHFGYTLKPGAKNQWSLLDERVSKSELLPGDLLFFSKNGKSSGIFHIGIYIGDGQFVHAANSRKGLIVSGINEAWYANRYLGAKRVIE